MPEDVQNEKEERPNVLFERRIVLSNDRETQSSVKEVNRILRKSKGEAAVLVLESFHNYLEGREFSVGRCRDDLKSVAMAILKGQEMMETEDKNESFVVPTEKLFICSEIDFYWEEPGANIIEEAGFLAPFKALCECFFSDKIWQVREQNGVFVFSTSQSDQSDGFESVNELIIGRENISRWIENGKSVYHKWGYIPLIFIMSHFLGQPLKETETIINCFRGDTAPARNMGIVLNYYLSLFYVNIEIAPRETLQELLALLPEEALNSHIGQLQKSQALGEEANRIIG